MVDFLQNTITFADNDEDANYIDRKMIRICQKIKGET